LKGRQAGQVSQAERSDRALDHSRTSAASRRPKSPSLGSVESSNLKFSDDRRIL